MIPGVVASGYGVSLPSVPSQIAALAPLLYFRMDETGTDNPLQSGSASISPGLSAPYTWSQTGALTGSSSTALLLSGGSFNFTRQAMTGNQTRLAWIKTTETDNTSGYDGDPALTLFGDNSGSVWDGFGVHDGKVQYRRFNNSTWQTFSSTAAVNDGNYHLIGVTYNSSTRAVVLYVDGVADGGGTMTAHQNQGGINYVGRGFNSGDTFRGTIDEAAAFNSLLTAQNFADLWSKSQTG